MAIDRNPALNICIKTYNHYSDCEPWLLANVGPWNELWWRDFPDPAIAVLGEVPQPDCYWFQEEKHAVLFKLRWA